MNSHFSQLLSHTHVLTILLVSAFFLTQPARSQSTLQPTNTQQWCPSISIPAASSLFKNKSMLNGMTALRDNLPQIAQKHFENLLKSKSVKLSPDEQSTLNYYAAVAMLQSGKIEEASALIQSLPVCASTLFCRAIIDAQMAHYQQALELLSKTEEASSTEGSLNLLSDNIHQARLVIAQKLQDDHLVSQSLVQLTQSANVSLSLLAKLCLAEFLLKQGRTEEAETTINQIVTPINPSKQQEMLFTNILAERTLIKARILTRKEQFAEANKLNESIFNNATLPKHLRESAALHLGVSEIIQESRIPDDAESQSLKINEEIATAEDRILALIASSPQSKIIPQAFAALQKLGIFDTNLVAQEKLLSWSRTKESSRQPIAALVLCQQYQSKNELSRSLALAKEVIPLYPSNPFIKSLVSHLVSALIKQNQLAEAQDVLSLIPKDSLTTQDHFLAGVVAFSQREYELAAQKFSLAAHEITSPLRSDAIFNQSLSLLNGQNTAGWNQVFQTIKSSDPKLAARVDWERVHFSAIRLAPSALNSLQQYIQDNPQENLTQARLDLAYVALRSTPPNTSIAIAVINELVPQQGMQDSLSPEQTQSLVLLQILLLDVQHKWKQAAQVCVDALQKYRDTDFEASILFRLAESLYKSGEFDQALLAFQSFIKKFPHSSRLLPAKYLAAKAAESSIATPDLQIAVELFTEIATTPSALQNSAKLELANLYTRMGKPDDAIDLLNPIVADEVVTTSSETYFAALSLQADALVASAPKDADTLRKAIALVSQIIKFDTLDPDWKCKALTQRAQFYERIGDDQGALDDYRSVIACATPDFAVPQDAGSYWYTNAAFAALSLLDELDKWDEAYALAKQLASSNSPRSQEAEAYAKRLKLEHFLWRVEPSAVEQQQAE